MVTRPLSLIVIHSLMPKGVEHILQHLDAVADVLVIHSLMPKGVAAPLPQLGCKLLSAANESNS